MKRSLIKNCLCCIVLMVLLLPSTVRSQLPAAPDVPFNQKRFKAVVVVESAAAIAAFTGLYYLWYRKYPRSHFHLFNDNREWLNMDKIGHTATAYNISAVQYSLMRWCGVDKQQATWIGGLTAIGFQTIIEVFDGFSQKWGFSTGDMLSNISGAAMFVGQQSAWSDQRLRLKFSYHNTIFPRYNPDELGRNIFQRLLKDYNGQTYWLSINPASFLGSGTSIPKWFNISFGYGATGMVAGLKNPENINGLPIPDFKRYRKYFVSLDADPTHMVSKNVSDQLLISVPAILKFPAPAIEWSKKSRARFHAIYY